MNWNLDIRRYDEDQREQVQTEVISKAPTLGLAIEEGLHRADLRDIRRGSYQITVTMK